MPLAKTSVVNIYYESGWGGDQSETKLNINSRISGVIVLNCLINPDETGNAWSPTDQSLEDSFSATELFFSDWHLPSVEIFTI